jgi:hypothetical protein
MLFSSKKLNCEIKFKKKTYNYFIEKHKTINDLYNLFIDNLEDINYPIMFRLIPNKYPFESTDFDKPLLSITNVKDENLIFEITKSYKCSSCSSLNNELNNNTDNNNRSNYISKYCLTCNKYICNICLKNKNASHNKHNLIDIDPTDLKNCVKLWCINLIADLSEQITSFKKQSEFMNDGDLLAKINLWKNSIINKINKFEDTLKIIFEKFKALKGIYQNLEDIYNKVMDNLIKNEKIFNEEIFLENLSNKNKYVYFSFDEAEEYIKKFKINHEEIEKLKKEIKPIINIEHIDEFEKSMNSIPMSLEELISTCSLILNDIKNFEFYKNQNSLEDNLDKVFNYPEYLKFRNSKNIRIKPKGKSTLFLSNNKTSKSRDNNNQYIITKTELSMNKISNKTNTYRDETEGKILSHISKLSDVPLSYSIKEYSKVNNLKNINQNTLVNTKHKSIKKNSLALPKIHISNNNDNDKNNKYKF